MPHYCRVVIRVYAVYNIVPRSFDNIKHIERSPIRISSFTTIRLIRYVLTTTEGGTKIRRHSRRHSRDQLALAANTDGTAGALLAIIRRLAMQLLYRDGTHTRYRSQSKGILQSRSRVTDQEPL